jgi:hypothetical protein
MGDCLSQNAGKKIVHHRDTEDTEKDRERQRKSFFDRIHRMNRIKKE